jgi:hypothetical protein
MNPCSRFRIAFSVDAAPLPQGAGHYATARSLSSRTRNGEAADAQPCASCIRLPSSSLNRMKATNPTTALATWISQKVVVGRLE